MAVAGDVEAVLAQNPWFRDLAPALARGILAEGLVRRVTDHVLYAAGDEPNGLFALIAGEIRVIQTTAEGRSALLLIGSPGVWFGETAMIDGRPRSSEAITVGAATVLQLNPAAFNRLATANIAHYAAFARLVCDRYRDAMEHIVSLSNLPLAVRIAQRLLGLARGHGKPTEGGVRIGLHLSQEQLAETVGVSRQSLNRVLKDLEARGLIAVGYGAVTLRDPAALERLARSRTLPETLG